MRLSSMVSLSLSVVLLGCASGGSAERPAVTQAPQTTRVESGDGTMELRTVAVDPTNEYPIDATPDRLWQVMPAVFAQLQVPVTLQVQAERSIGNRSFEVRRQLGGVRLSRYMSCGEQLGNPNADSYLLTLRIVTRVLGGTGEKARLFTVVDGTAKPVAGSGGVVSCTSNGQLERRLVELAKEQLKRGG